MLVGNQTYPNIPSRSHKNRKESLRVPLSHRYPVPNRRSPKPGQDPRPVGQRCTVGQRCATAPRLSYEVQYQLMNDKKKGKSLINYLYLFNELTLIRVPRSGQAHYDLSAHSNSVGISLINRETEQPFYLIKRPLYSEKKRFTVVQGQRVACCLGFGTTTPASWPVSTLSQLKRVSWILIPIQLHQLPHNHIFAHLPLRCVCFSAATPAYITLAHN